ncbi:MAG: DUF1456 family protein [Candidatus Omnitrophica bacterium]|nr:DUF1456 family protein [Candidatus Omnitrophota bacterium]
MNNNDIMKKLRIALSLRDTDMIAILKLADFEISATELSAIFRKEDHPQFMPCGDQILRRFLDGLIVRNRGVREPSSRPGATPAAGSPTDQRMERRPARQHRAIRPGQPPRRPAPKVDTIRVYRAEGA